MSLPVAIEDLQREEAALARTVDLCRRKLIAEGIDWDAEYQRAEVEGESRVGRLLRAESRLACLRGRLEALRESGLRDLFDQGVRPAGCAEGHDGDWEWSREFEQWICRKCVFRAETLDLFAGVG